MPTTTFREHVIMKKTSNDLKYEDSIMKGKSFTILGIFLLCLLVACDPKNSTFFDSDLNEEITPNQFTLTLTTSGEGEGTITSDDGKIDCPPNCDGEFPENYNLELL